MLPYPERQKKSHHEDDFINIIIGSVAYHQSIDSSTSPSVVATEVTFHPRSRPLSDSEMPSKQEIIAASIEILDSREGCFQSALTTCPASASLAKVLIILKEVSGNRDTSFYIPFLDDEPSMDYCLHDLAYVVEQVACRFLDAYNTSYEKAEEYAGLVVQTWITRTICDLASFVSRELGKGFTLDEIFAGNLCVVRDILLSGASAARAQTLRRWCALMGSLTATSHTSMNLERIREVFQMYTWAHFVRASAQLGAVSSEPIASSGQSVDPPIGFSSQQTVTERQDSETIVEADGMPTDSASISALSHQLSVTDQTGNRSFQTCGSDLAFVWKALLLVCQYIVLDIMFCTFMSTSSFSALMLSTRQPKRTAERSVPIKCTSDQCRFGPKR